MKTCEMKKEYIAPVVTLMAVCRDDVLTSSGGFWGDGDPILLD